MGNKALDGSGLSRPDGIERISNALFTGLIGVVLLCALLPIFISQIAGLSSDDILSGWDGLGGFQSIAYILPVVFIIGLIILIVRFFSGSRE